MIFENIPGFNELSEPAKKKFISTCIVHQNSLKKEQKAGWKPIRVVEAKNHIKVHFYNGEWLNYYPNNSWEGGRERLSI
ncbi:hypothetical protein QBE53_05955 [Vallitaleaceae bacterium 9-2]